MPAPAVPAPPLPPTAQRPSRVDWALLAVMLAVGYAAIYLNQVYGGEVFDSRLGGAADYVAFTALTVPVVFRRLAPIPIGLFIGVGFAVFRMLQVPEGTVSSLVLFMAIHAVGAYGPERGSVAVRGVVLAAGFTALVGALLEDVDALTVDGLATVGISVAINLGFYITAWVLGDAARRQRASTAELARRAEELAAEREKVAAQAVTEERVRIARELHDVVAHHVSVMGVQAAAARHVLGRDPEGAARALAHVEASGREAVAELHRLVGILRSDAEEDVDGPQPTLEDLDRLVGRWTAAGMDVQLRRIGRPRPLPTAVALSAYRIIQEALTNARRHAPGAPVTVVLSHLADVVQVEVVNGTPAGPGEGPGGGRGLLGMRERVALLGGDLEAGRLPGGGFRTSARLPAAAPAPVEVAG